MEEEGNQPGKEMNQESENHSRFYLVNIFAKKKEKSKHWRGGGRGMLQEMSQIKGKVGAVWALQGRTEEGKQLIMFYVYLYVKECKCWHPDCC